MRYPDDYDAFRILYPVFLDKHSIGTTFSAFQIKMKFIASLSEIGKLLICVINENEKKFFVCIVAFLRTINMCVWKE